MVPGRTSLPEIFGIMDLSRPRLDGFGLVDEKERAPFISAARRGATSEEGVESLHGRGGTLAMGPDARRNRDEICAGLNQWTCIFDGNPADRDARYDH